MTHPLSFAELGLFLGWGSGSSLRVRVGSGFSLRVRVGDWGIGFQASSPERCPADKRRADMGTFDWR